MEKEFEKLAEQRIAKMEQDEREFPRRFGWADYLIVAALCGVCLAALIVGAGLG